MELSNKILSDITVFNKYAKHLPHIQRRETWDEIVDRYRDMMIKKYPQLENEILKNILFIRDKKILPSMRAMQFAGPAIKKNNSRLYNCAYLPINDYRAFSEAMFLLLGGTGCGYSVQKHHVEQLPEIQKPLKESKYLISDSLEGWSDAIKALMKSYFGLSKHKPRFDYSDIRPKGARLVTAGGKAPGPAPLKECLVKIENILESKQNGEKLKSIDCHGILCYIANAVLSGGIRRSACIALFSFDDHEMLECKYGNWWELHEEYGRANNSAVIVRSKITKDEFNKIWEKIELSNSGEPGLYFTNDKDLGVNPCCFTGDTKILTSTGYKKIKDCLGELELINKDGEVVNGLVWSNGEKEVIEISLSNKIKFQCTEDHKFMTTLGETVEAKNLSGRRLMPYYEVNKEISEFTKYGFIQGDGGLGRLNSQDHKGLEINIEHKDGDIFEIFNIKKVKNKTSYYVNGYNEILKSLQFDPNHLSTRRLPKTLLFWETKDKLMFFKGMYSANGSIIKGQRIAYKTTSKQLASELQENLASFGISSYVTTNKEKNVLFSNGNYICKESYDINISQFESVLLFSKKIGFVHKYKTEDLIELIKLKAPKVFNINLNNKKTEEVFDFNLHDNEHWGVIEGIIAHNCEISLKPFSFCNLTEINVSDVESQSDLNERAKVAAFFGTLQAGFTDFHYLRPVWKQTTEKEALIGVGMTGISSGKILDLDLKLAAEEVKLTNEIIAKKIEINKAARCTTIKPSGTTSCILGTSSGIHAWYSEYYIRRIRIMKNDPLYIYLIINHFELVEDDKLRSHDTAIISIPQKAPEGSILRTENALDLLERTKKFNLDWVKSGHRKGANTNNVSATISINKDSMYVSGRKDNKDTFEVINKSQTQPNWVMEDEWKVVGGWMWKNKDTFNGLSVIPHDNGSYVQAPFEECTKEKYEELMSKLKDVDLSKVVEIEDNTDLQGEVACAGGQCSI